MKRQKYLWLILLGFACAACKPTLVDKPVDRLTPGAEVVFTGEVRLVGSATMLLDNYDATAVVKVRDVLKGEELYGQFKGDVITIRLLKPAMAREGEQRVFFARSWMLGESAAVIETGSFPHERGSDPALRKDIASAREAHRKDLLMNRLRDAELVLSGKVDTNKPHRYSYPLTEHDPQWQLATIKIDKLLKGSWNEPSIDILYPGSIDIMWYQSPRFGNGTEGIWILKPEAKSKVQSGYLTALENKDFLELSQEEEVRELLEKLGGGR